MWLVFYKYVHGKELNTTNHVFYSPVSCSCKQQIHLAGSLGKPVISEVLILQISLDCTPFGKGVILILLPHRTTRMLQVSSGCYSVPFRKMRISLYLKSKSHTLHNGRFLCFISWNRVLYGNKITELPKGLFEGLFSLQLLWVFFFFIYSILRSFKRVNMMRYLCQKKNWQEIPYVRSKYSKIKLC